jgi:hypothetical protein
MKLITGTLLSLSLLLTACTDTSEYVDNKSTKTTDGIHLPSPPKVFNTNLYVKMSEVCLNGFVYYIGNGAKRAIMAPKYVKHNSVQSCPK